MCSFCWDVPAPERQQLRRFFYVFLCLANCAGGSIQCDISNLCQVSAGRDEPFRISDGYLPGRCTVKRGFVLCAWLRRKSGKGIWKAELGTFCLGFVIVGLEVGWIYAYKAGWQVSTGFIVQSAFLAAVLLFVGYFLYHEALTWKKLVGMAVCVIGLILINWK